jgi:predicted ribonuclease YlaK
MFDIQHIEVPGKLIDELHREGTINREATIDPTADDGGFYLLTAGKKSALGVAIGDSIQRVVEKGMDWQGIKPRDKAQLCMFHSLSNFDLTVVLGAAGTGKTTVATAYALHQFFRHEKKIVLSKPSCFVGGRSNAIAAVPGDAREKIAPYVESFMGALRSILGDHAEHHLYEMEEKGNLMFQPLELIRGLNFDNHIVIIDEAQNTTAHELLSLISRVGQHSQCIVMGDPSQIDMDITWQESGLRKLLQSDSFYDDPICQAIKLKAQYRGPLAELAQDVLDELLGDEDDINHYK